MCEFRVFKKDKILFKDAVYAKADGKNVTVRDVLGFSKLIENCTIAEVDVSAERLLLAPVKK
jgi:predicted RNA-binding protein